MNEYKHMIYIVEDVAVNRLMISNALTENGFEVIGSSTNAEKAWEEIQRLLPSLILLDIHLSGDRDGLWLGMQIYQYLKIPFIYITAYQDQHTTQEITETHPFGFIVKPLNTAQLITTVNIALDINRISSKNHIVIQDGLRSININADEIIYLQSEGNYVHIYMENNHLLIRSTLTQILEKLPTADFQRIHQRYAIHLKKSFTVQSDSVLIHNVKLSISASFKQELKSKLII